MISQLQNAESVARATMILILLTAGKASFSAIRLLRLPLGSVQN